MVAIVLAPACSVDRSGAPGPGAGTPGGRDTVLSTDSERAGEAVYRAENCARCHTLFDRPRPYGPPNLPPGPALKDAGSRVGPDLGLEGHRHSDEWHFAHFYAPAAVVRGSRMPPSRHLFRASGGLPVPTRGAAELVAYLQALGRGRRDVWAEWRRRDPDVPPAPVADRGLLDRGRELYRRHCASCHGDRGDGRGEAADFFGIRPRDLAAGHHRFKSTPPGRPPADTDLFRTITLGSGTGAAMPAFYWLPQRDRWALVLAVKELAPALRGTGLGVGRDGAIPPASGGAGEAERGDHAAGRRLWDVLGCASCHGADGKGMSRRDAGAAWADAAGAAVPRSSDLTHACALRAGASPEALERSILLGVGAAMPSYADSLPDEASLRSLIAYIRSLDKGSRR
ncbi:MAG: c-type cytochrome [Acidobacteria bacterium]|nr:c-type cytochrome [Acidobacteriota bacterium]